MTREWRIDAVGDWRYSVNMGWLAYVCRYDKKWIIYLWLNGSDDNHSWVWQAEYDDIDEAKAVAVALVAMT